MMVCYVPDGIDDQHAFLLLVPLPASFSYVIYFFSSARDTLTTVEFPELLFQLFLVSALLSVALVFQFLSS